MSLRVGARQQKALVRVVRSAGACLLAVQHPLAVVLFRTRPQTREVAARVGLAEPLAEDQLAAEDLVDVGLLLPLRSVDEQGGREQADPEAAEDDRSAGLRHLLLIDRLHDRGRGPAAGLERPRELQPPALVELALPLPLEVGVVVLAKAAHAAVTPLGGGGSLQPRSGPAAGNVPLRP